MGQPAMSVEFETADSFKGAMLKAVDQLRDQMQPVNADMKKGEKIRARKDAEG
jgi:hypothetical protein